MHPLEVQFRHALLRDPDDAATLGAFADWLRDRDRDAEAETWLSRRSPATVDDRTAARALALCRFAPATWDKRFVRDMTARLDGPLGHPLGLRQRHHLYRLVWRYRLQIAGGAARLPEVEAFLTRVGWFLPTPPKVAQPSLFADAVP